MIFRRLRRILAAENADYTSIAYFPALFKSEFRRKSESDHRYTKKAAQSENCTAFLKNLWCGRQDLNLHAEAIEPKSIVSANSTTGAYFYINARQKVIRKLVERMQKEKALVRRFFCLRFCIFYVAIVCILYNKQKRKARFVLLRKETQGKGIH